MELLKRKTDYALRCLVRLAETSGGKALPGSSIAGKEGISGNFVNKILQKLGRAGLVVSTRGVNGGYRLALPPEKIEVKKVVELMQGGLSINLCFRKSPGCGRRAYCRIRKKLSPLQGKLKKIFDGLMISDLAVGK